MITDGRSRIRTLQEKTMTQTTALGSSEISLPRLNDGSRAVLFTNARTANNFRDRPVSEDQLRALCELMKWGPTWANTLPLRILYLTMPEGKARLLHHLYPVTPPRRAPPRSLPS